jgi:hypothetical protein
LTAVALGPYRLEVAHDYGPRLTSLRRGDGPEILARLPADALIEHDGGVYRFHGGHRLWVAPEVPKLSYANDDHQCFVGTETGSITVQAGVDDAGFTTEIVVTLDEDDWLRVDHTLTREPGAIEGMAAWAITQFPLDGIALMPVLGTDTGPQPNRQLVLWPYTSPIDYRLQIRDRGIEMSGRPGEPIKVGTGPYRPRLGYLNAGQLFVKEFLAGTEGEVPDLGAKSQIYVGQGFCELETLSGLAMGTVATLSERWKVHSCDDIETAWRILVEDSQ